MAMDQAAHRCGARRRTVERGVAAFERSVTARFYEGDQAGIVFFARFFEYCHAVFEDMLAEAVGGIEELLRRGWGLPLAHAECDYQRPVRVGERLRVRLEIDRLGERSITFRYAITSADGAPCATVKLVHVFVERPSFASAPIPGELTDALRRLGLAAGGA
jgi:1,4-dihydroxy-2-naphthoyl-CoA hydrolase